MDKDLVQSFIDVSVIIPCHGRVQFTQIVAEHFKKAIDRTKLNVSVTFVEHDEVTKHKDVVPKWCKHIFIPFNGRLFNKCLCHNTGFINSINSKWFLFHDIDTLVPSDFFDKVFKNIEKYGYDAIQTFHNQRLLHCNQELTNKLFNKQIDLELLNENSEGIKPAVSGAKGGSILVSKDLFMNVGGYDDHLFTEYSVEDAFFYEKIRLLSKVGKVGGADDPIVNQFHLYHEPSFKRITKDKEMKAYEDFNKMDEDLKIKYITSRSKEFNYILDETKN